MTQADVLVVCSSGGHLFDAVAIARAWRGRSRAWVSFDKADVRSLLAGERLYVAHGPTNRNIPNLLRNIRLAARLVRRERPRALLTTGAGVAVPFAWMAKLLRIPVIYIESFTRIEGLSLSGRMIKPIAARTYVQWPELAETSPQLHFAGNVFAG